MMNFSPEGIAGEFFQLLGRYAPPLPPGALPPVLWGLEAHVRTLFGEQLAQAEMTRLTYVETAASARDYCDLFQQTFGPMVAIRGGLGDHPERLAAFDREFMEFVTRSNRVTTGDRIEIPYEYLLVVARRR